MAKCMVRWEGQGEWRGPFEVVSILPDWVRLGDVGMYSPTVPRAWTLGVDDGWTIFEGGGRPDGITPSNVDVMFRNGALGWYGDFVHKGTGYDIVAYRVVEEAPKTLDQAWDEEAPSIAEILNDWWLDDVNTWRRVLAWDMEASKCYRLSEPTYNTWVSRDWFTGRRHLTADELAEEMEI